ncbi:glycosyltransferase [Pseudoalteromonas sp. S16_S37]|uniref:glycosyltransferase n=1 Tax=Pseudoalteromonas sp. S16_S37 TaxID=2720228 RepID=UPI0016809789|nr:glycosyltransferase [Pseudoalteromonas sp. S16_S37]MBD1582150.1 glycosyltransferase [Pseudoalteromonas sp. S16_S37]
MKVLHIVQHLKIGGLEKMAVSMVKQSRFCHETRIAALEGTITECFNHWPELAGLKEKFDFIEKKAKFDIQVVSKLVALIDKYNIEIVHSHHIGPMLYASLACLKRPQVKHVSTVHDAWYLNSIKPRLITKLLNKLSPVHWIADANVVAHDFYAHTSIKPKATILNGIDCNQFAPINMQYARYQLGLPKNVKIIGCAARLELGKGHVPLIEALEELPQDYHLAFAGRGSLNDTLQNLVNELGLQNRVHFLGGVHKMEVFYSAIDVFSLFSEREGLPLSILEAMACGIPIVASDVGGIKEVLTNEQGYLLPLALRAQLSITLKKATSLQRGDAIRAHALSIAQIKNMSSKYDQFYRTLTV